MKILLLIIAIIPLISPAQEQVTAATPKQERKELKHNIKLKSAYALGLQYERRTKKNY